MNQNQNEAAAIRAYFDQVRMTEAFRARLLSLNREQTSPAKVKPGTEASAPEEAPNQILVKKRRPLSVFAAWAAGLLLIVLAISAILYLPRLLPGPSFRTATQPSTAETETEASTEPSGDASLWFGGEHPETLCFDVANAFFEIENEAGRTLRWEGGRAAEDSTLELLSFRFLDGSIGDSTSPNAAYLRAELPYDRQYTFRSDNSGLAVRDTSTRAMAVFYGEGLREAVWLPGSVQLSGEASDYSLKLFCSLSDGHSVLMTMTFFCEETVFASWRENTVSLRGASGDLRIRLYDTETMTACELDPIPIQGDLTLRLEPTVKNETQKPLRCGKLIFTDPAGTREIDLTWTGNEYVGHTS